MIFLILFCVSLLWSCKILLICLFYVPPSVEKALLSWSNHNLQYYIIHNHISLTHRQYYTYVYCYIHEPAHQSLVPITLVQLPSHRKNANLYITKQTRDPKFDPCFLQLSDLTNVVRQCDKYNYSMNVQAQKYNERKSNFEVAKWWL